MANDDTIQRLRYFTGQFLQEQDFKDEQAYHIDQQRRHNRTLHTQGIADNLRVTSEVGNPTVTVHSGTALDAEGRQIILLRDAIIDLRPVAGKKQVLVVISYPDPEPEGIPAEVGDKQNTRIFEQAHPVAIPLEDSDAKFPPRLYIRLTLLEIDDKGNVIKQDDSVRVSAGARGGEAELSKKLDEHVKNHNNPHIVTAKQVNALPITGGTVKGPVTIENPGRLDVLGRTFVKINVPGIYNGTNSIAATGSLFVINTESDSYALVAKVSRTNDQVPKPGTKIPAAAVVAIASFDGVHGIYATSNTETPALNVDGTALINGKLSSTHIVDTFTNASGQRLTTGDVVKLKGTPVTRFRGQQNKAPIAEVTLTDRENDTLAIGIVDGKAFQDNVPDTKLESESAFIEDGEDLYLVTLGVFAHCKVDATEAPIEVGDLLTTSKNPGHAKKAIQPKLGSIIGKALQPLEKGTGEISVFVNIQ